MLFCFLTLPWLKHRGFLVPRDGLRQCPLGQGSSGHFSPGVFRQAGGFRLPDGTLQRFLQDVARGVLVAVEDESASGADMRPHGEGLLDHPAASTALLGGPGGFDRKDWHAMDDPVVPDPAQECSPARIMDGFGEMAVPLHVAYLQVFKGNQIAR